MTNSPESPAPTPGPLTHCPTCKRYLIENRWTPIPPQFQPAVAVVERECPYCKGAKLTESKAVITIIHKGEEFVVNIESNPPITSGVASPAMTMAEEMIRHQRRRNERRGFKSDFLCTVSGDGHVNIIDRRNARRSGHEPKD